MRTLLLSTLALGALTSAALAEPIMSTAAPSPAAVSEKATVATPTGSIVLSDGALDKIKAGTPPDFTGGLVGSTCDTPGSGACNHFKFHGPKK